MISPEDVTPKQQLLGLGLMLALFGTVVVIKCDIDRLDEWILFITFCSIVWTAIETSMLRGLQAKSIRLSVHPIIILKLQREGMVRRLYLANIGSGNAFHMSYRAEVMIDETKNEKYTSNGSVDIIETGSNKPFEDYYSDPRHVGNARMFGSVIDAAAEKKWSYTIILMYKDVEGTQYEAKFVSHPSGLDYMGCREV